MNVMSQFTEALTSVVNSSKKIVEPSVFDGDVLEFADWEIDMNNYLKAERVEGRERLQFLKKYVSGEARKCGEGHFTINTNEAYIAASTTLKERFGNQRNISTKIRCLAADSS